ncbi:MAG TPA: hypothetical protein VKT52_00915, partial [Ktedonobacterales bacterium]|nr:hypothetical protein [Ktedonobacterales bacterium]
MGAESSGSAASDLVVYLNAGANQAAPPLALMRREAESLMQTAGYSIQWRDAQSRRTGVDAPNLVFVELSGACIVPMSPVPGAPAPDDNQPSLATTAVEDGVVLPFSRIDCAALTRILSSVFAREAPGRRTYLYGRAMGRLLAHELYHVLAQTRDHVAAGIGKPCFTASDLVADRFEFESVALARLQRPPSPSS